MGLTSCRGWDQKVERSLTLLRTEIPHHSSPQKLSDCVLKEALARLSLPPTLVPVHTQPQAGPPTHLGQAPASQPL